MRLKLLWIVLAGVLFSAGEAYAQRGRTITPFTPRIIDSTGKKVYVQPQEVRRSRISITVGYGYSPVTSYNSYANKRFPFVYNNAQSQTFPQGDITSCFGTVSLGFNYEITPWLELNIPIVYSHSKGWQECILGGVQDVSGYQKDEWITLLPTLRINWMRNNWLSLYTRAGIGIGLGNRYVSCDGDQTAKATFAYQVSPVGVEMGKGNLCFYVEGGYGFTGMVMAGIKLKVGKVLKNNKVSSGRHVNWYDKYLY